MMNQMEAKSRLQEAISLHAAHMDGSEPTSPESQERLMALMESALEALGGEEMGGMGMGMSHDGEVSNQVQSEALGR